MREHEFVDLWTRLDRSSQWPDHPDRGALNFLTERAVRRGLGAVLTGAVISCADRNAASRVLHHRGAQPALKTYTEASGRWIAVNEAVSYEHHGPAALTHIDSFSHFFYRGRGFGEATPEVISANGVSANDVVASACGIVGRGLLVDLPRIIGMPYVPVERLVRGHEVRSWLESTATGPESGDLLFVRTGRPQSPLPAPGQFFNTSPFPTAC
jgi:hypothetical protein